MPAQCAFYLHNVAEIADPERCFPLSASDFARVNPNTGTAPLFCTRRDAALTTAIYGRLPVLVDRSTGAEVKTWPVTAWVGSRPHRCSSKLLGTFIDSIDQRRILR
jgi:hypothetical protein